MPEANLLNLFDTYADMVYRLAYSYLRQTQDAEDAVQAVFLKLIEGTAQPILGKERAFLAQITVNYCRDVLRSVWRKRVGPLDETIAFVQNEDRELFHLVMALPSKYRVVIHLHYYEGYSFSEIGTLLKIGSSAVSMRLFRAKNMLKKQLGKDFYEALL